jgi:orotidine-5'-phosphate decarboxylase
LPHIVQADRRETGFMKITERGTDQSSSVRKLAAVATIRNDIKPDTCVSCPVCSCEIPVLNTKSLPREFSVLCPGCGARKLYHLAQAHDQKEEPIAAQPSSQRIQFGMKKSMQPKNPAG